MNWYQKHADQQQASPPKKQPAPRIGPKQRASLYKDWDRVNNPPKEPVSITFKEPTAQQQMLSKKYQNIINLTMKRDGVDENQAMQTMQNEFGRYPEFNSMREAYLDVQQYQQNFQKHNQDQIGTKEMPLLV